MAVRRLGLAGRWGVSKDIDQVMANQTDLVEVVHMLKQVFASQAARGRS